MYLFQMKQILIRIYLNTCDKIAQFKCCNLVERKQYTFSLFPATIFYLNKYKFKHCRLACIFSVSTGEN